MFEKEDTYIKEVLIEKDNRYFYKVSYKECVESCKIDSNGSLNGQTRIGSYGCSLCVYFGGKGMENKKNYVICKKKIIAIDKTVNG